tara:strand:- start:619 stop:753 length:135 start_codon:yes stop_codon:yes gene_type:complete
MACFPESVNEVLRALYPVRMWLQVLAPVWILLAAYIYKQVKEAK